MRKRGGEMRTQWRGVALLGLVYTAWLLWRVSSPATEPHSAVAHLSIESSETSESSDPFSWTLITTIACKQTPESYDIGNILAYQSWRKLRPAPAIVYVSSCHPSFAQHPTVTTVKTFDRTTSGLPLFSDMMALSERVTTDLVAWTNADILLSGDVTDAILNLQEQHTGGTDIIPRLWMSVAARWDISMLSTQINGTRRIESELKRNGLASFLRREGVLHTQGGGDFFVWNMPNVSTIHSPYPPYIRSSCSWDNWWINEAARVRKNVIDSTAVMTLGHLDHSYFLSNSDKIVQYEKSKSRSRWSQGIFDDWRMYHNNVIARTGRYSRGFYTGLGAVMNLKKYIDKDLHMQYRETTNEPSAYSMNLKFPIFTNENILAKGIPALSNLLEDIPKSEHVLLTGVTFGYIDVLMNWVCTLRRLNMDYNYLIAAFDKETFEYLYLHGMPVFYPAGLSYKREYSTAKSAFEYGQQSFKDTTKLKIASVKIILEQGYDVLWSDSDILFFKDFRSAVGITQHDVIMQSNNPLPRYKGYFNQRINSGFYFIRSNPSTLLLVKEIIDHSLKSLKSEQMSFDAVLCANSNEDFCTTSRNKLVTFFDYHKFPNGGVLNYWDGLMQNGTIPEGAFILHNNWIKGYSAKINRIIRSNYWFWDKGREVCMPHSFIPQ